MQAPKQPKKEKNMNHIEAAKQMAAQLQEKIRAPKAKTKTYRVCETTATGQHLNDVEEIEVEEGEDLEEILCDVASHHAGEAAEAMGWCAGAYGFQYEWEDEAREIFLVAQEI